MQNKDHVSFRRIITRFVQVSLLIMLLIAFVTPASAAPVIQEPQPTPAGAELQALPVDGATIPTDIPAVEEMPVIPPTATPSNTPDILPTALPSETPVTLPTAQPSETPITIPTALPTEEATLEPAPPLDSAPLSTLIIPQGATIIPNRYIVVLKAGTNSLSAAASASKSVSALGGKVTFIYTTALQGYAAYLPPNALTIIRSDPSVAYVEADQKISIVEDNYRSVATVQSSATWGLDRIDQRNLPLNSTYSYTNTASNVNVYVIDTGIRSTHTQFGGRATKDYDSIGDGQNGNDCHGHGTHVAGTIGSATYGIAKNVKIHAIRVLDCGGSGSTSGVVAGVDWVTQHHTHPAVVNMSLGGGVDIALDTAIQNSINHGVTYVIAGGNASDNACYYSPARLPAAITAGSTTNTDARSYFSNYGTCIDIFAPGSNITSTWNTSDSATNTISGTSMASPHVAGVAALYLSANTTASPAAVASALISNSTLNKVTDPGSGSPNRLLYSLFSISTVPGVPTLSLPTSTISIRNPTFTWLNPSNATFYWLFVNTSANIVKLTSRITPTCSTTCSYTPSNLNLPAGSYKWSIRAGNAIGLSTYSTWRNFSISAPAVPVPASPSGAVSTRNPTFTWSKPSGATLYWLYVNTSANGVKYSSQITPTCSTTCSYTPTNLNLPAGSYKWAVRAGNPIGWSNISAWLNFSVSAPAIPTLTSPNGAVSTGNPTFTWSKPSWATSYWLYVNTSTNVVKLASQISPTCSTTCSYTPTNLNLPAGSYKVAVRAGNTLGLSNYSTWINFTVSLSSQKQWTFMVYLAADNNLEPYAIDDFLEMATIGSTSDVNIVVQLDRNPGYDTRYENWSSTKRFYITRGMTPTAAEAKSDLGEVNMGAQGSLESFTSWAKTNYPANKYALILWNHGGGFQPQEERFSIKGVAWDDTDGNDYLSNIELSNGLSTFTNNGASKVELVGFDACLMAMLEVDQHLKDYANTRVSSEETEPGEGWPYNTILSDLTQNPTWSGVFLANAIANRYYASYGNSQTQAAAQYGSNYSTMLTSFDTFIQALRSNLSSQRSIIGLARTASQDFDVTDYIDLYDFAYQVYTRSSNSDVRSAANNLISSISNYVTNNKAGSSWPRAHGLSIFFPATQSSWGTWASTYQSNQWLARDTYWNEFLSEYFQNSQSSLTISLTWGAYPRDLDAHLWLPSSYSSHVYFANRGSLTSFPYASLETDNLSGYGPETISISHTYSGTYQYAAYNYSNETSFKNSNAIVNVYQNSILVKTYNVSSASGDSSGRWWRVFTYNADTDVFTDQNTLLSSTPAPYNAAEVMPEK